MAGDETAQQQGDTVPLYPLPQQLEGHRPARSQHTPDLQARALVIDNGSFQCKAGWAGEDAPRITFRAQACRPRNRAASEQRTSVGDWFPGLKGWEVSRMQRPFDGPVVYNVEAQEALLDWAFDRLAITGGSVEHPVLITECLLNPPGARAGVAELLFESYGVPAVQFVHDGSCAFHYGYEQGRLGGQGRSGLVVSSGHSSTSIVPIVRGQPVLSAAFRSSVCGSVATEHLQKRLLAKYPGHAAQLSTATCQLLKERYCYCAADYGHELAAMQRQPDTAGGKALRLQLPWSAPKLLSPEEEAAEFARRAAKAEELRERMKAMAAANKQRQIREKTDYLAFLEGVADQVDEAGSDSDEIKQHLAQASMRSRAELNKYIQETRALLTKWGAPAPDKAPSTPQDQSEAAAAAIANADTQQPSRAGGEAAGGAREGQASTSAADGAADYQDLYPLLSVPDDQLDEEGLRQKKRQKIMRATAQGQAKLAERRRQLAEEKEQAKRLEDEQLAADPQGYIDALKERHRTAAERLEARKRRRFGGGGTDTAEDATMGAGKRRSAKQRQRMRLVAEAAFRSGKASDDDDVGFGADDADWEVYKEMDAKYSDSDDAAEDEAEHRWTAQRLKEIGVSYSVPVGDGIGPPAARQQAWVPTAEDYQVQLGVERVAVPELLFQPTLCGIDQAGVPELVMAALRRLSAADGEACAAGGLLLTGGNAAYPGLAERLARELMAWRPMGKPIPVVVMLDPHLDAWRGAAQLAAEKGLFQHGALVRAEYKEGGIDYLRERHGGAAFPCA